jgi:hypothetical protein
MQTTTQELIQMSAFLVSQEHVNTIVNWACKNDLGCSWTGQVLWSENWRSVNHRYPTSKQELPPIYNFKRVDVSGVSVIQFLKLLDCLEYQSCEHDGWAQSEARQIVDQFRAQAVTKLPGYEEAEWSI